MIEEILEFYRKTKLKKELGEGNSNKEAPVTFTHVFHKTYPRLDSIKLPPARAIPGDLDSLLASRRSYREFTGEALSLEELSDILGSIRLLNKEGDFERRTYPSGGARFPIEVYPITFNVSGLNPGVYHYNFTDKSLDVLWKKDLSNRRDEIVSTSIKNPAATIFMTSVLSRSDIKYGPKAFGYSMIEAGHMAQNMSLMAEKIGLGYCSVCGFIDDEIIDILDLVNEEIPIYSLALGKIAEK